MTSRRDFFKAVATMLAASAIPTNVAEALTVQSTPGTPPVFWNQWNRLEFDFDRLRATVQMKINGIDYSFSPQTIAEVAKVLRIEDDYKGIRFGGENGITWRLGGEDSDIVPFFKFGTSIKFTDEFCEIRHLQMQTDAEFMAMDPMPRPKPPVEDKARVGDARSSSKLFIDHWDIETWKPAP